MKSFSIAVVILLSDVGFVHAADHRELGPHEHGHGTLTLAFEGNSVAIELEAPGDDIVGFEHDPSSTVEKDQIEKAKATLAQPLILFGIPEAAKCKVKEAKVTIQEEQHENDEADAGAAKGEEAHHNEFHAEYTLECNSASELKALSFSYFQSFKNAQALSVSVTTSKGESKFEATRDKPAVNLIGLM